MDSSDWQKAYSVDGEIVRIDLIDDKTLLARADEYEAQAKGLNAHALEIREYVSRRVAAA